MGKRIRRRNGGTPISKSRILATALIALVAFTVACGDPKADVVSKNISTAADNFEVQRRIVFYNGITDSYMLTIEGLCSLGNHDDPGELTVTCKVGANAYKKHFLGLSDNVTYFVEQLEASDADPYHYRVVFRPTAIIPNIDVDVP